MLLCSFLAFASFACSDSPVRIDETVTPPVLIKKVEVLIPDILKGVSMKASLIILKAVITEEGNVTNVKAARPGQPLLVREAISAVKRWKYKPAKQNGEPVSVYFTVTVLIHVR